MFTIGIALCFIYSYYISIVYYFTMFWQYKLHDDQMLFFQNCEDIKDQTQRNRTGECYISMWVKGQNLCLLLPSSIMFMDRI